MGGSQQALSVHFDYTKPNLKDEKQVNNLTEIKDIYVS
jgi:hypothetical protein